jgi:hypothetical protein
MGDQKSYKMYVIRGGVFLRFAFSTVFIGSTPLALETSF